MKKDSIGNQMKKIKKVIEVKCCYDCPFLEQRSMFEGYCCGYPESFIPKDRIQIDSKLDSLPKLCPLRVSEIEETRVVKLDKIIKEVK